MRIRAAVVSTGIALLAFGGMGAPAQAADSQVSAASWTHIADYGSNASCVNAGQQYVREGFRQYRCNYTGLSRPYSLWVR